VIATATERLRWRRDLQARWGERRIAAYAEYASTVKTMFQLTLRIAAHRGVHPFGPALPPVEGLQQLLAAGNERAAKWETVLLVGTPDAVEAAREWHRTIYDLEELVCQENCDKAEWAQAIERSGHARSKFYQAARRDLGLVDAQLPNVASRLASRIVEQTRSADGVDGGLHVGTPPSSRGLRGAVDALATGPAGCVGVPDGGHAQPA
jgi:hypothetical protein